MLLEDTGSGGFWQQWIQVLVSFGNNGGMDGVQENTMNFWALSSPLIAS
jgi:hypothetical protein